MSTANESTHIYVFQIGVEQPPTLVIGVATPLH